MEPFEAHTGLAMPLARVNVDTDQIIPKQYLTSTGRDGLDMPDSSTTGATSTEIRPAPTLPSC